MLTQLESGQCVILQQPMPTMQCSAQMIQISIFSLTLPPWLDNEMDIGTGGAENQGISDGWQADASAEPGPSNFDGAWQSDNLS
jgi:hypothetical protein